MIFKDQQKMSAYYFHFKSQIDISEESKMLAQNRFFIDDPDYIFSYDTVYFEPKNETHRESVIKQAQEVLDHLKPETSMVFLGTSYEDLYFE